MRPLAYSARHECPTCGVSTTQRPHAVSMLYTVWSNDCVRSSGHDIGATLAFWGGMWQNSPYGSLMYHVRVQSNAKARGRNSKGITTNASRRDHSNDPGLGRRHHISIPYLGRRQHALYQNTCCREGWTNYRRNLDRTRPNPGIWFTPRLPLALPIAGRHAVPLVRDAKKSPHQPFQNERAHGLEGKLR